MAILRRLFPCRHKGPVEGIVVSIVEIISSDELVKGGDGFGPYLISCRALDVVEVAATIACCVCAAGRSGALRDIKLEADVCIQHHYRIRPICPSPRPVLDFVAGWIGSRPREPGTAHYFFVEALVKDDRLFVGVNPGAIMTRECRVASAKGVCS